MSDEGMTPLEQEVFDTFILGFGMSGREADAIQAFVESALASERAKRVEAEVVEVHHFDMEKHAESFNEGYEAAVTQGLADDPALADEWLARHDAEGAARALEEAADIVRAEVREQWSRDEKRLPGAQIVAQRMTVIENTIRARAAEKRAQGD